MTHKNRLLYPLVIGAVLSVATFSCLGIAAITGHLPVGKGALDPFFTFAADGAQPTEEAVTPGARGPTHRGLTRQSGADPVPASRPFGFRPGQRIAQSGCASCGVIHSIEPGVARPALVAAGGNAGGQTQAAALVMEAIHSEGGANAAGNPQVASFVVRVKMEDGTVRTIYEIQRPRFSVGERVRLINGSIVSQS